MVTRDVILVAGPPCAGKTTWVAERAQPGDIVLDQDAMGAAEYRRQLARVAAMTAGRAYVIRCLPGADERARFAAQIRATRTVLLVPPLDELLARARARPQPHAHVRAVRRWFEREQGHGRPDPPPRGRTRW